MKRSHTNYSYKIGDSFVLLPLSEVQELLSASVDAINNDVTTVEEKLETLREEMQQLKNALYGLSLIHI